MGQKKKYKPTHQEMTGGIKILVKFLGQILNL